mmetsp:Transcript_29936/g.71867  ORF Transcript_29936/g.71867 Transcript_29936/m.71867 type:complete len:205 (+) Transcript_29936:277-891(+)
MASTISPPVVSGRRTTGEGGACSSGMARGAAGRGTSRTERAGAMLGKNGIASLFPTLAASRVSCHMRWTTPAALSAMASARPATSCIRGIWLSCTNASALRTAAWAETLRFASSRRSAAALYAEASRISRTSAQQEPADRTHAPTSSRTQTPECSTDCNPPTSTNCLFCRAVKFEISNSPTCMCLTARSDGRALHSLETRAGIC